MKRTIPCIAVALGVAVAASGCSLSGGGDGGEATSTDGRPTRVVLVTHDSFALPAPLVAAWEKRTGYRLVVRRAGDAGALTNKLVLTKDRPIGDVAFGVDNAFASRALDAGVFEKTDVELPVGAEPFQLPGADGRIAPVDNANVCVNVDADWFSARKRRPPASFEDLTRPAYRNLFVTPGATTSSPGMAFFLATVARHGDGWKGYWTRLMANGTKVTSGWSDAYEVDFTAGGGGGTRPIVVSYDSSPAFTVSKDGTRSSTKALLDTCFRQVEYAGVLAGARNPRGGAAVVELLLSADAQAALPTSMYVFPVRSGVTLPKAWAAFAKQPPRPAALPPATITANREKWMREWTDVTSR
ncbi:MAG: thiamine ABC transporter substrate-binding protein [Thermoleophilia bacterium]|nr:thiamine ABC transporter substrate-binding protein [Thermoleophilia bacterium]